MNDSKPPLYLATGLLLGLGLGYLISVILFPAQFLDGAPAQLNIHDRTVYRSIVAQAYAVSNNLERASARLALLGDQNPARELAGDAQRMLAEGKPLADAEILARLASELKKLDSPNAGNSLPLFTPEPGQITPTQTLAPEAETTQLAQELTPAATSTSRPTPSPAPTLGAPFELKERLIICQPDQEHELIQIQVDNHAGEPVPGVQIDLTWQNGEEYFFTGLIPSVNPGFADYKMASGIEYALRVGDGGEQVRAVQIPECNDTSGEKYPGSVYLRFTQP